MREAGDGRTQDDERDPSREPDGGTAPDEGAAPGHGASADIAEALRQFGATGRATWSAGREAATALRVLVSADISLARSAFGRTLAFTAIGIAFGASAWLLLMATLIVWLSLGLGWAWSLSLLLAAALSTVACGLAGWRAMRYFEHTRLQATRRQLARLGIGELSGLMPDAGSGASSEAAAEQVAAAAEAQPVKKGLGVDITPP